MNAIDARKQIQSILHCAEDGIIGPKTLEALTHLSGLPDDALWPAQNFHGPDHTVTATSFADPADVYAFRKCKAEGGTDLHCFGIGDNAIGFTGMDCSKGSGPSCALPPEDWMPKWGSSKNAAGKPVKITYQGNTVIALMKDTLPHQANIKNGAGIDLNPDACEALGLNPPVKVDGVSWGWA